jgi:hypothetical protein
MISHQLLGKTAYTRSRQLKILISKGLVTMAGNRKLGIFGTLECNSGKRMKLENRVFFVSEKAAQAAGFRPCGHCMRAAYLVWKEGEAKLRQR